MLIHRVSEGEGIEKIANKYCTCPVKLCENNGILTTDELVPGDSLLVAIPTRTYTVKSGDTLSSVARRFNIKTESLLAMNPSLFGEDKIYPTMSLAVKYERQNLGMAAANGYFCPDCSRAALIRALPYLVYVTLAVGVSDGVNVYTKNVGDDIVGLVKSRGKIPLLRIYDGSCGSFLKSRTSRENLCCAIVEAAKSGGYSGVVFASYTAARENSSEYSDFIFDVRKKMIGSELIFITECNGEAMSDGVDLADGNILVFSKIDSPTKVSFEDFERQVLTQYAGRYESSKTFIDLSAFAYDGENFIPLSDIRKMCRKSKCTITHDETTMLSSVNIRGKDIYFESLECIKAKLELVGELGFMGINIDIKNTPISHLIMFYTMFSPVYYNSHYSDI